MPIEFNFTHRLFQVFVRFEGKEEKLLGTIHTFTIQHQNYNLKKKIKLFYVLSVSFRARYIENDEKDRSIGRHWHPHHRHKHTHSRLTA